MRRVVRPGVFMGGVAGMAAKKPKLVDRDGRFLIPVLTDNAEQLPYTFADLRCDASDGGGPLAVETRVANLTWGDYSLLGFENQVSVERKSWEDAVRTISGGRDRFKRELAALSNYKFAAVVVETDLLTFATQRPPFSEADPKNSFRSVMSWSVRYRVPWLFCGSRELAEITTFRLLEKFAQQHCGTNERGEAVQPVTGGQLADATLAMLDMQQRYFSQRSAAVLAECKRLEAGVRGMCHEVKGQQGG